MNPDLSVSVHYLWPAAAVLDEGPVWDASRQVVIWVNVKSRLIHLLDEAKGVQSTYMRPEPVGACLLAADGRYLVALKGGLALVHLPEIGDREMNIVDPDDLDRFDGPETGAGRNRFNDAKVYDKGRLWAGTLDDDERDPTGARYRVNADRTWAEIDDGYIVTNGPALSGDRKTLSHTDTFAGKIHDFDVDASGNLWSKRVHINIPKKHGYPGGMTVDAEGCL